MRTAVRKFVVFVCLLTSVLASAPAFAQNWSFDARNVGLGGVGSTSNIAFDMVDEQRPYRPIVLPFGLLQILPNLPKLDPTSDEFDLVRSIEYAASPIHYIVGRDSTNTASAFITDLRNGTLSRDLNVYRGFNPATSVTAEGLMKAKEFNAQRYYYQGIGRFDPDAAMARGLADLTAIAELIPPHGFVHGEKPSSIDAAIYGFIANIYFYDIDTPLKRFVVAHDNIVRHCKAIHAAVSAQN